ncbi:MAG: DUF2782 domain-containing protein [Zoogloeaceae bacterium]|jgi:hypothetical protein|nr:DUF2782 domain-containing protein [Zoogloeaceae bacterium]
MRRLLTCLLFALALPAAAQGRPAGLEPVPEPPPSPYELESEKPVTIIPGIPAEDKVEEYRINGRLFMIKVTPNHGTPYYLVDERGDGQMIRQNSLDTGLRVPMWVIGTF